MDYICDHKSEACEGCKHALPHSPINVTPFEETCINKGSVCFTPREVCKCKEYVDEIN